MPTTVSTIANLTTAALVTATHVAHEFIENATHAMDPHHDPHHDDHHGHHGDHHVTDPHHQDPHQDEIQHQDDHHDHHAVNYIPWDNPDNVLNVAQTELSLKIIDCGFIPPIVLFGLVGNILTIIVFLKQGLKEKTNICLLALAISDTMFLLTTYMEKAACVAGAFDEVVGKNWAALLHPQGYFISLYFGRVTSVLTMVISLERCIAVLRPLQTRTWLTAKRMRNAVICVYVLVLLLIAPMFCVYNTHSEFDTSVNRTRISLVTTEIFNEHHQAFECYGDVALSIVLRQIPCYMVALSTIAVICTLRRQRSFRSESGTGKKDMSAQEQKLTRMLIAVSVLYVSCLTPGNIIMIVRHVITDIHHGRKMHNLAEVLTAANVLTEIINSSFNFVIYMIMSSRFSATLKTMVGMQAAESKQPGESSSKYAVTKSSEISSGI